MPLTLPRKPAAAPGAVSMSCGTGSLTEGYLTCLELIVKSSTLVTDLNLVPDVNEVRHVRVGSTMQSKLEESVSLAPRCTRCLYWHLYLLCFMCTMKNHVLCHTSVHFLQVVASQHNLPANSKRQLQFNVIVPDASDPQQVTVHGLLQGKACSTGTGMMSIAAV